MKTFKSLDRQKRIAKIQKQKLNNVLLILDNIKDDKNISPIIRSAECFGIKEIIIIYKVKKPRLMAHLTKGSEKWINIIYFKSPKKAINAVREKKLKLISLVVDPKAKFIWKTNLKGNVALVLGNEINGVSEEIVNESDLLCYIPMKGLTESLNVSAASAVTLYELLRQNKAHS